MDNLGTGTSVEAVEVQANANALNAYNESINKQNDIDPVTGFSKSGEVPEGFNADGTPVDTTSIMGGRFKTQAELENAFRELEAKGGNGENAKVDNVNSNNNGTTTNNNSANGSDNSADSGSDNGQSDEAIPSFNNEVLTRFEQEVVDNGSLSEASYQDLARYGFNKSQVDAYIQGQQALATQRINEVYGSVGGVDNYTQLVTWAATNMPADFIAEYNESLTNSNTSKTVQLLEYMNMKAGGSQNTTTNRITGTSTSGVGGTKPFETKAEWQKMAQSPLYGKDAKYTQMVQNRYLASLKSGKI